MKIVDIYKKSYFETVSEYRMAMSLALEFARRGMKLDFTGMKSQVDLNSPIHAGYKNFLINNDMIIGATRLEDNPYDFEGFEDLDYLDSKDLFEDNKEYVYWDRDWFFDNFGSIYYSLTRVGDMPQLLERLVCRHWVDNLLGLESRKLFIRITKQVTATVSSYLDIVSLYNSVSYLSDIFSIVLDEGSSIDLKLSLFHYDSVNRGHHQQFSVEEKENFMNQLGFREGMVLVLFERKPISETTKNTVGKIISSHLVRLDEVVNGRVYLTMLRCTRTYEEIAKDFMNIPENNRYLYLDLLDRYSSAYDTKEISLRDLGIGDRFYAESFLIDSISLDDYVTKLLSNDGVVFEESLNEAEAIYYTLKQNDAPIDYQLFRDYYFNGEEGFYDKLNQDGVSSTYYFVEDEIDLG